MAEKPPEEGYISVVDEEPEIFELLKWDTSHTQKPEQPPRPIEKPRSPEKRVLKPAECDPFDLNESSFIETYRLSKDLTRDLCEELKPVMPDSTKSIEFSIESKYGIPNVVGCVDCTHVPMARPDDDQKSHFNKSYHSKKVQIICDSDSTIISVDATAGGSYSHDNILNRHAVRVDLDSLNHSGEPCWLIVPMTQTEERLEAMKQKVANGPIPRKQVEDVNGTQARARLVERLWNERRIAPECAPKKRMSKKDRILENHQGQLRHQMQPPQQMNHPPQQLHQNHHEDMSKRPRIISMTTPTYSLGVPPGWGHYPQH
ncbi:hypothetical protein B5X24_HaOG206816 [Helicoverpa armigera]|uniref:DDE Tnp4 domain-containing protein n=1 Tax=Helicoverpa armigera TaxID=29058 RepID=A0A2W1BN44_HELAM|nr:hypothetical protein B5X24_HaOG206816 [Helicoverpa armigera]